MAVGHTGKCIPGSAREIAYDSGSLEATFFSLRNTFPRTIRLVLAEELLYVLFAPLSKGEACDRDCIASAIQGMVPEKLSETVWDSTFVKAPWLHAKSEMFVHVRVVRRDFFKTILTSMRSAGFGVELASAESCALTRLTRSKNEPVIIGRSDENGRTLLIAAHYGIPLATELIGSGLSGSASRFLDSVKAQIPIAFMRAELSPLVPEDIRESLSAAGIAISEHDFNLCSAMMLKNRIHGKHALVSDFDRD